MILVYAGVQADQLGVDRQRLPPHAEDPLAHYVRCLLHRRGPRLAMGAAASGSDIIIAETALAEGIPVRIILPFDEETFEATSLRPHGERWLERFHTLLAATGPALAGHLDPTDPGAYELHNQVLLNQARKWAVPPEQVQALAIRPPPHSMRSTTDDFVERSGRLAIPVLDLDPLTSDGPTCMA